MQKACIHAIEYYLPEAILDNATLAKKFPEFSAEKILAKTGIQTRHVSADDEFASDMAVQAATKLFQSEVITKEQIDFVIFCTQTPDYLLPTSACLIQEQLELEQTAGALDINLGCSGYVYGLSVAKGLIESGQAKNILFLTGDTYTKLIEPNDKSVKTIFGDAASATLISAVDSEKDLISKTAYGSNGAGAKNLCVLGQGIRSRNEKDADPFLRMQGPKIFEFTLEVVPQALEQVLQKAGEAFSEIDLFVLHQANAYMLEHLRKKLNIPREKFWVAMDFCGNTVSSTIPIALKEAQKHGVLKGRTKVMLIGFGVGYSWGATIVNLSNLR